MQPSLAMKRVSFFPAVMCALALGAGCSPHGSMSQVPQTSTASSERSVAAVKAAAASGEAAYPSGNAWPVPGTIDFDNYDTGGEGVAYHTQHTTNPGGKYRTNGVGIEGDTDTGNGNGFDVGWN